MSLMNAQDVGAISEGRVVAEIDGRNILLFEVKEFTPEVELNKEDVRILGERWQHHKVTSMSGSGTLNLHYVSTTWAQLVEDYQNGKPLPKISLIGTMEDPSTAIGKQTVRLENVMPDKVKLIHLEADDGITENEMDFTFAGMKIITSFNELQR